MARAALMIRPGASIEVREMPPPLMEPGSVLLQMVCSEICGTDVHLWHGRLAGVPYPIIPGHVSVGRVVETVGVVRTPLGDLVRPGDLVTFLDVHESCHHCWYCLVAKETTRCPSRKVYGITYSADGGLLGGWAEQIYLKPGVKIIHLPAAVSPERFIAAGCALPTALHAIDRSAVRLGDTVVVQGCGPVGLNAALLAMLSGAGQVIVLDRNPRRLEAAARMGIDVVVPVSTDPDNDAHRQMVLRLTQGRGADITIEATGSPRAVEEGPGLTRDGGKYVIVGHYTDTGEAVINPHTAINRKQLDIRGCWGSDFSHFYRAVGAVTQFNDRIAGGGWEQCITGRYRLDQLNEALGAVERGESIKSLVVPDQSG